jgi:quercetin 2,3-dioxygenase
MDPPEYQEVPAASIPHTKIGSSGSEAIVIAGQCQDTTGPVKTTTPITYVDIRLAPGDEVTQPVTSTSTAMAYVYRGVGIFGSDKKIAEEGQLVVFEGGEEVQIRAGEKELRILFLAGEPLKIPVVSHGPFVMCTQEEIYQAFEDYQAGRLGEIPGKEERYAQTAKATGKSY